MSTPKKRGKSIKKVAKIAASVFAVILLLISAIWLSLRTEAVQNLLVPYAERTLSNLTGTTVSIDRINLRFHLSLDPTRVKSLELEGIYVEDHHADTLLYAKSLQGDIGLLNLGQSDFTINNLSLSQGHFYLRKYQGEEQLNLQVLLNRIIKPDSSESAPISVTCHHLNLDNIHFVYRDEDAEKIDFGLDFANLDLKRINLELADFRMQEDTISTSLLSLGFQEHSGFQLRQFGGDLQISPLGVEVQQLVLQTGNSKIQGNLRFIHKSYAAYSEFLTQVKMQCQLDQTDINLSDLAYFAPDLRGIDLPLSLKGRLSGRVSNLKAKGMDIRYGNQTMLQGDFNVDGLPELDATFLDVELKKFETTAADLAQIPVPPFGSNKHLEIPPEVGRMGTVDFSGNLTGFISDFVAYGKLKSDLGTVNADMHLQQEGKSGLPEYAGELKTTDFNLAGLLGKDSLLGRLSLDTRVSGMGIKDDEVKAELEGRISRFDLMGYTYKDIEVNGTVTQKTFLGELDIRDPNIRLSFDGLVDLSKKLPEYRFTASLDSANLVALNLLKREEESMLSVELDSDFKGNDINDISGFIHLRDLHFEEGKHSIKMDTLSFNSELVPTGRSIELESRYLDATLVGRFNTNDMLLSINNSLASLIPSYFPGKVRSPKQPEDFQLEATVKHAEEFTQIFMPEVMPESDIRLVWSHESKSKRLGFSVRVPEMVYDGHRIQNARLAFSSDSVRGKLDWTMDRFFLGDSMPIRDFNLRTDLKENKAHFEMKWRNNSEKVATSELAGNLAVNGVSQFQLDMLPSVIFLADSAWQINEGGQIKVDSTTISCRDFRVGGEEKYLRINGRLSNDLADSMFVELAQFELDYLNVITAPIGFSFHGVLDGRASVSDPYKKVLFGADMAFNELGINGYDIGSGNLKTIWSRETEALELQGDFEHKEVKKVMISGNYYPNNETDNLDLKFNFNKIDLPLFEPLVEDYLSDVDGLLYGRIQVKGELDKPQISGGFQLENASLRVDYLNTVYTIKKEVIRIEPDWMGFDLITLRDEKGNKAIATGTVFHENFENFNLDIAMEVKNFAFLNTNLSHNDLFYGKAFLTGDVNISGYAETLDIAINGKTGRGTYLAIPLSESEEISESDFITFVDRSKTTEVEEEYEVDLNGIQMNFELDITDDAEMEIIFDKQVGDVIRASGNGHVKLEINTLGKFNIYGEYVLSEGDYLFTLQNIINKRFNIESGGTILFNGSPYDAQLDVNAIYTVRTSPADLGSLIDSTNTRKVPVAVDLHMTGNMLNPDIRFGIDFPTLPSSDAANLIISGLTDQELNQQVFSLLIIRRFVSTDGSLHGGSFGSSSSSEVLSNQLTNWLSQISNDFDLGFNYNPGDEVTTDEVELIVSTQLFNDRVSVETNFGVGGNEQAQQSTTNNVVGDFNIEYKINEEGTVRTRVFNKSNQYNMANFNNSPYTQGVGVFYRTEFHKFGELVRKLFKRKDKKDTDLPGSGD